MNKKWYTYPENGRTGCSGLRARREAGEYAVRVFVPSLLLYLTRITSPIICPSKKLLTRQERVIVKVPLYLGWPHTPSPLLW